MRRRTAFTIIELLVSMALIVFIMAILAEAFVEGLKTFRTMKAIGDMNARLRTVENMLRDDLIADHFQGKLRLSDPSFWLRGPVQEGYLRVWHGSPLGSANYYSEGNADGIESYYATDHYMAYTVKKRGNERQDFYSANVPVGSPLLALGTPDSRYQETDPATGQYTKPPYNSQWVEVAWHMRANGATAGAKPLYTLYRGQRVIVPSTVTTDAKGNMIDLNFQWPTKALPQKPDYLEVSTSVSDLKLGTLYYNSPRDVTIPERRFGMSPTPLTGGVPLRSDKTLRYPIFALSSTNYTSPNYLPDDEDGTAALANNGTPSASLEGTDVILTDVLSFAIVPIFSGVPTPDIAVQNQYFTKNYPGVGVFDTWSNRADNVYDYTLWDTGSFSDAKDPHLVPNKSVLTGLQISIRVWDEKTKQARQVTVMQDL
jgi:type II secretory pathway pseudopilin PulG